MREGFQQGRKTDPHACNVLSQDPRNQVWGRRWAATEALQARAGGLRFVLSGFGDQFWAQVRGMASRGVCSAALILS